MIGDETFSPEEVRKIREDTEKFSKELFERYVKDVGSFKAKYNNDFAESIIQNSVQSILVSSVMNQIRGGSTLSEDEESKIAQGLHDKISDTIRDCLLQAGAKIITIELDGNN